MLYLLIGVLVQVPEELPPCPDSPNCVNTYQVTEGFDPMTPLPFEGSVSEAMGDLREIINSLPRTEIVANESNYMKAVFTIAVFGFKDDVEFLADDKNNLIHFRSASRTGYYDFGVNRNRMEKIQKEWMNR
ncbi:MAG: DUF1499 domain-containing protein [Cyclobacteriaceae bacterium]